MVTYILRSVLGLAYTMLAILSAQARQSRPLAEFAEALQAGITLGRHALDGEPITHLDVARVRKEFNEALDALEPLLPLR